MRPSQPTDGGRRPITMSVTNCASPVVEAMNAAGIRRQRTAIAGSKSECPDMARGQRSDRAGIDIEERIAAQMLGDCNRPWPALPVALDLEMFGPHADGSGAMLPRGIAGDEIHLRRADKARDKKIGRLF